ncbi:hypothetical protein FKM82_026615 [Ascaphus truei]
MTKTGYGLVPTLVGTCHICLNVQTSGSKYVQHVHTNSKLNLPGHQPQYVLNHMTNQNQILTLWHMHMQVRLKLGECWQNECGMLIEGISK